MHIYHDLGYTVGLATQNFDCAKDHPLIGAKILEENKKYFVKYLDETSFDAIHRSVLFHAVVYPNLTPDESESLKGKINPRMVRAMTSITDACAITYERKSQEFWDYPEALVILARLKFFLVHFPQYEKSLQRDNNGIISIEIIRWIAFMTSFKKLKRSFINLWKQMPSL